MGIKRFNSKISTLKKPSTGQISEILQQADLIRELANELKDEKSLLFIGRGYNYATCLEGALVSGRVVVG